MLQSISMVQGFRQTHLQKLISEFWPVDYQYGGLYNSFKTCSLRQH